MKEKKKLNPTTEGSESIVSGGGIIFDIRDIESARVSMNEKKNILTPPIFDCFSIKNYFLIN
jgi:hypothetical protein